MLWLVFVHIKTKKSTCESAVFICFGCWLFAVPGSHQRFPLCLSFSAVRFPEIKVAAVKTIDCGRMNEDKMFFVRLNLCVYCKMSAPPAAAANLLFRTGSDIVIKWRKK